MPSKITIYDDEDGSTEIECENSFVARVVSAVGVENIPDAIRAAKILNTFETSAALAEVYRNGTAKERRELGQ
jgi:hypothetical protein